MGIEVTDDLVSHIARLSRLALSPEEAEEIKGHFRKVLSFVEELQELDLQAVDPSLFSLEDSNIMREDSVGESLPVDQALANAPEQDGSSFVVPRILADGSGGEGTPP